MSMYLTVWKRLEGAAGCVKIEKANTDSFCLDIKDKDTGELKATILFETEEDVAELREVLEKKNPLTIYRHTFDGHGNVLDTRVKTCINGKWQTSELIP